MILELASSSQMQNKRDGLVHIAMNYERTKRKSCYDCRRLVTHCSAAIIHSKGFITKLLLVNTLITQYHSHARIVTQLRTRRHDTHAVWTTMSTRNRTITSFIIYEKRKIKNFRFRTRDIYRRNFDDFALHFHSYKKKRN